MKSKAVMMIMIDKILSSNKYKQLSQGLNYRFSRGDIKQANKLLKTF